MEKTTCCFTGHRVLPEGEISVIEKRLEETIKMLVLQGVRYFGAGGARGFDLLAQTAVLRLKKEYPFLRLILVLPCWEQTRGWNLNDTVRYEQIRQQADKVVYLSDRYDPGCMQRRNRHLIDHSHICVCYCTRQTGSTAYTVSYSRAKEIPVINLAAEP